MGSKKSTRIALKSAPRRADIYLGNCDLQVTSDDIKEYIHNEMNISIEKCEPLASRNPNCKSFKITLNVTDRQKLLSADVWPENIICRKFFNPKNNISK